MTMAKMSDYYPEGPDRERERNLVTWLEAPGDDYGMFVGGPPDTIEKAMEDMDLFKDMFGGQSGVRIGKTRSGHSVHSSKHPLDAKYRKFSPADHKDAAKLHVKAAGQYKQGSWSHQQHTMFARYHEMHAQTLTGKYEKHSPRALSRTMERVPYRRSLVVEMTKALPKKSKEEKPAKKAKSSKASSKTAGKGGKTRYSYSQEKAKTAKQGKPKAQEKPRPIPVPEEHGPPSVDPNELANQLGVTVDMLTKIVERFHTTEKLGGRKGFAEFMRGRLKHFHNKHDLDNDYWGLVYDSLQASLTPK